MFCGLDGMSEAIEPVREEDLRITQCDVGDPSPEGGLDPGELAGWFGGVEQAGGDVAEVEVQAGCVCEVSQPAADADGLQRRDSDACSKHVEVDGDGGSFQEVPRGSVEPDHPEVSVRGGVHQGKGLTQAGEASDSAEHESVGVIDEEDLGWDAEEVVPYFSPGWQLLLGAGEVEGRAQPCPGFLLMFEDARGV